MNPWVKHVLQGLGGGGALGIVLVAIKAIENRPEFLPQLVSGQVLMFAFGVVALVMIERGRRETNAIQLRNAVAQERIAGSIGQQANSLHALSQRSESHEASVSAGLRYVASALDETQKLLKEHCEWSRNVDAEFKRRVATLEARHGS